MNSNIIGQKGEDIALEYLIKKGYDFIEKNYKVYSGEIDLIFRDGTYLVFVEVKYRKNIKFGYPRDFVTTKKQRKIISAAESFIEEKELYNMQPRFDVVEIIEQTGVIEHLVNAFP
ncbi:YraN family protein [Miniphocaeibacter massiliensis]|uniref:YraN family protein n=1 Tax=Miniphocaeibacter massiliensis TaxID=2041841 RepID=UPI000C06F3E6|nr:YraN family protein [Miniphocaeibacter massiliensis]